MLRLSKSYIRGFGRVIDINGSMKTRIIVRDGFTNDRMAIERDWINVGKEIQKELNRYNISGGSRKILESEV